MSSVNPLLQEFFDKISARSARLAVIGLGYVGLPLARALSEAEFHVTGFDIDLAKIEDLRAGRSYLNTVPASSLAISLQGGRFQPTTDFSRLAQQDAVIICVPTPLTPEQTPDLSFVVSTVDTIAQHLRRGQLIVLESTTYPGTTREVVLPILEVTGLTVGTDFFLAFSSEREDPGRTSHTIRTIPKVVGGVDPASTRAVAALYGAVVDHVVPVSSSAVAEASKILENVYRAVNIALVNELKMLFDKMGIDIWEVIAAAATKPFGFQPFYPGPGLGGHCIPVDPFYLAWKARDVGAPTRFIELVGEINVRMPLYVLDKLSAALQARGLQLSGARVLVLGLAYKKDLDDLRESPAIVLIERLRERGTQVDYNDPHIGRTPRQRDHDLNMVSRPLNTAMLGQYDAVLIATDHSVYDYQMIVDNARLVIDTRNATADVTAPSGRIVKA
jgi:UDP-N-acetyl-D-glucosamine dehydrogenase